MSTQIAARPERAMQTRSTPPSIDASVSRTLTDLQGRVAVSWNGSEGFKHGQGLTVSERAGLVSLVAELDHLIGAPLRLETARVTARKLSTMPQAGGSRDAAAFVDALIDALPGTSDAALQEATRRILANEEPSISDLYMATTPQVVGLARRIAAGWKLRRDRLAKLVELAERPAEPKPGEFSEERMAALRKMNARLTAAAARTATAKTFGPDKPSAAGRVAADIASRKAGPEAGERSA